MKNLILSAINIKLIIAVLLISIQSKAQNKIIIDENEKTSYSIYIEPSSPKSVKDAAADLKNYINKASGISLNIVSAAKAPAGNYISLGNTSAFKAAGFNTNNIKYDGYTLVTKGNNLFIFGNDTPDGSFNSLGGTSSGTANGVYTFLEDYLGIRWITPGESGEIVPKTKKVAIPVLNRTESPIFSYKHLPHIGSLSSTNTWVNHQKLGKFVHPQYNHAWEATIPASMYDKHPTWFAKIDGKHLPPAERHKLESTNPELVQAYADVIIRTFRKNADQKWYSLSPSDGVSGEAGWGNSEEALALLEKDPNGKISRTKLILMFYNDVARIVKKKFPDHKLGGYIYSNYFYPPKDGIPKMEPNLALMVAPHIDYGYQLYKESTRKDFEKVLEAWGESSKRDGYDLYFYDLPTALIQHNGVIMPPAPEILNFIFPRLVKYGFKGAYVYGRPIWPIAGASNYALAKLIWDPNQNAQKILDEYYINAYGTAAAAHISKFYNTLDSVYKGFYNTHPKENYNITNDHLKEIYADNYNLFEQHYLNALTAGNTNENQKKRLEALGQVFSLMQWNLRSLGYLSANYNSKLTVNDERADEILTANQNNELEIATQSNSAAALGKITVQPLAENKALSDKPQSVPVYGNEDLLLYAPQSAKVKIHVKEFEGRGEFVRFIIYDTDGKQLKAGAIQENRNIEFDAEAGKSYLLDLNNRRALIKLSVDGAAFAYNTTSDKTRGFRIHTDKLEKDILPLFVFVPKGKSFGITMSFGSNLTAELYDPEGNRTVELSTKENPSARFVSKQVATEDGFWKIMLHKSTESNTVAFTIDEDLPQWIITDAHQLLKIK